MHAVTKTSIDLGTSFTGALDSMPASAAAYSVARRLLTSYTGALIRVRRSSDNAESDIGYVAAGGLDTATLLTFCGAGSGFVVKIYDQSGNGRDISQATLANQPQVVDSGVTVTNNGKPAAIGDASNDALANAYQPTDTAFSASLVLSKYQTGTNYEQMAGCGNFDGYARFAATTTWGTFQGSDLDSGFQLADVAASLQVVATNVDNVLFSHNGATTTKTTAVFYANVTTGLFGFTFQNSPVRVSEYIYFPTALSSGNRISLEENQRDYYGITP